MKPYLGLTCLVVLSAVCSETGFQCAAITVIPNVTVTLINDSTYFNCSTTSEKAEWRFISDEYLQPSVIYSYGTVKPLYLDRFRVEKYANNFGKQFNLILQSVAKDDAGRYICRDPDSRNEEGDAQLIVIETKPVCEPHFNADGPNGPTSCAIKPEIVQLSCKVRYSGKQVPELQWIKTDENIVVNSSILECWNSGNLYTCNLKIKSSVQTDKSSYVCQTKGSRTRQYRCTSDILGIIYALGEHTEQVRSVNDKVNCSVNSKSQFCTYSWNFDNGTINKTESHDQVIEFKRPGRFICEAVCPIRNINCTFTTMTVNVNIDAMLQGDDDIGPTAVGIIVTIVVVLLVAVIGVIVFILWKKQKQNGANKRESPEIESLVSNFDHDGGAVGEDNILKQIAEESRTKRVRGLTILDDKLYLAFEMSSIIEAVPINFLEPKRKLMVDGLMEPGTIAACATNNCLYIMDQRRNDPRKKIFTVKPDGTVIQAWDTEEDDKGRISVNRDGNVVMTVYNKDKLKIYSPEGVLLAGKTIDFLGTPITHIFYAMMLADGNFIISHGMHTEKCALHRVCKVDAKGNVSLSFGNEQGSDNTYLSSPAYLAEGTDGSILVADQDDRIIMLNSELKFETVLFTKEKDRISRPEAMYVYENTAPPLLFLGCNETINSGGYLLVFRLGQ